MPQQSKKKTNIHILILLAFFAIGLGGYALSSNAQYQDIDGTVNKAPSFVFKTIMTNGLKAGGIKTGFTRINFTDSGAMEDFYAARDHAPIWTGGEDLSMATEALQVFKNAWTQGLNPETYHVDEISSLLDRPILTDKARLELLLTDAAIRYGRDLSGMRFDPKLIKQKAEYWRTPLDPKAIVDKLARAPDPVQGLRSLEPNTKLYRALQSELERLSREEIDYDYVLPMDFNGDNYFKPGKRNKDVQALRVRLGVEYKPGQGPKDYYDDNLAAAVMKFQRGHGLEPDGIIGPQTLAVLNRTKKERMEQIVANMERLRWLDQEKPDRYILVNIPQQLLWAVDHGKVKAEMPVVVGSPWHRTKEFKAEVTGVRFNPDWTVPQSIKVNDFLPKLRKDPGYLAEKGIEIFKGYGRNAISIDPMSVNWNAIGWREMGKMRFIQTPGDHNALGRIRILMPNEYNIYMHDTNEKEYFERGQRTYSHGCIRLSDPPRVADFVLRGNKDYSVAKRKELLAAGETVEVETDKPFPIYVIYQSMWLDDNGRLVYGPDVYKRDKELISVLSDTDGFWLPGSNATRQASAESGKPTALAYNQ